MRRLWCKWFHHKFHQWIIRNPPYASWKWCWECEEEVK